MTFTTEENNKKENINIEPDFKTKKKIIQQIERILKKKIYTQRRKIIYAIGK